MWRTLVKYSLSISCFSVSQVTTRVILESQIAFVTRRTCQLNADRHSVRNTPLIGIEDSRVMSR